jgi:hypothetical protein
MLASLNTELRGTAGALLIAWLAVGRLVSAAGCWLSGLGGANNSPGSVGRGGGRLVSRPWPWSGTSHSSTRRSAEIRIVGKKMAGEKWRGFLATPCAGRATLRWNRSQTGAPTFLSASSHGLGPRRQKCRRSGWDAAPQECRPPGARCCEKVSPFFTRHFSARDSVLAASQFRISDFGFRISDFPSRTSAPQAGASLASGPTPHWERLGEVDIRFPRVPWAMSYCDR